VKADNFSINDRLSSEPSGEGDSSFMTSHKKGTESQFEGGHEVLTENKNVLDTDQLNNDLLSGIDSP